MKSKEKRQFRFWHELKRRGVPRVLAVYTATAFIVIEASDIIFPRLGLPDWTVTLLIILLIVGFPVAIILSWIFDITPQGVIKTEPMAEREDSGETAIPQRRKIRFSDVLIIVLLATVLVLIYPKIFGARSSGSSGGEISIAVMPFKNMTGDTVFNIWQGGLQNLVITALSSSEALSVRQYETMLNILKKEAETNFASITPTIAGNAARMAEANTVIVGNLYKSGEHIRITSNIMNPETQVINKSFELSGATEDDFFLLADSLSRLIKNYLELKSLKKEVHYELKSVFTQSAEAYKHYLMGQNHYGALNYPKAIENFRRAIEIDSSFVSAMIKLAYCYGDTRQAQLSKEWAYKAYEMIDRLPPDMQWLVNILIAAVEKRPLGQVQYLDQYLNMHPQAMIKHYQLGWVKYNLEEWEEAIDAFETSLELAEKQGTAAWVWTYSMLGSAYHFAGFHKKELDIYEAGRNLWPQQKSRFDYWQAVCAISRGDSTESRFYLEEIRKMTEQTGWPEANLWLWYAGVYNWAEDYETAEYYFRSAQALRPDNPQLLWEFAQFLISRDVNPEEGLELVAPLVEQYPDHAAYLYTYGLGLYKQGSYEEAREALQRSWDLRAYYDHKNFTLLKEVDDILDRTDG